MDRMGERRHQDPEKETEKEENKDPKERKRDDLLLQLKSELKNEKVKVERRSAKIPPLKKKFFFFFFSFFLLNQLEIFPFSTRIPLSKRFHNKLLKNELTVRRTAGIMVGVMISRRRKTKETVDFSLLPSLQNISDEEMMSEGGNHPSNDRARDLPDL